MKHKSTIAGEVKVSIAVITFNQVNLLKECLDSCLNQTYENIEIIVADDGSTDGTHEMLENYSINYPEKFVLRLSRVNQGITKNSNAALFACSGKYIAIMGGDDLMHQDKIREQVEFMEKNESCYISYHDMDVFESATNKTLYLYGEKNNSRSGDISTIIQHGTINCASATMYRANRIPCHGFREELPVVSDWMLTIDTLALGGEIIYLPKLLGRYRRHVQNVSGINSPIRVQGTKDLIRTCSICLEQYPEYSREAIYRLGRVLRESRKIDGSKYYYPRLRGSLLAGGGVKSFLGLFVYKLFGGRIII